MLLVTLHHSVKKWTTSALSSWDSGFHRPLQISTCTLYELQLNFQSSSFSFSSPFKVSQKYQAMGQFCVRSDTPLDEEARRNQAVREVPNGHCRHTFIFFLQRSAKLWPRPSPESLLQTRALPISKDWTRKQSLLSGLCRAIATASPVGGPTLRPWCPWCASPSAWSMASLTRRESELLVFVSTSRFDCTILKCVHSLTLMR